MATTARNYSKLASDISRERVPSLGQSRDLTLPGGGRTGLWSCKIKHVRSSANYVQFCIQKGMRGEVSYSNWSVRYGEGQKYNTADEAWNVLKRTLLSQIASGEFAKIIDNF